MRGNKGCTAVLIILCLVLGFAIGLYVAASHFQPQLERQHRAIDDLQERYANITEQHQGVINDARELRRNLSRCYSFLNTCERKHERCTENKGSLYKRLQDKERPVVHKHTTKLQRIIKNVSKAHEYEADVYDCTEFSEALTERLRDRGWKASVEFVRVDCDTDYWSGTTCEEYDGAHNIVRLDELYIEAVSGRIIMPHEYDVYGIE